jgi:hypothetical protein
MREKSEKSEKSEVLEGGILSGKAQELASGLNCNYLDTSTVQHEFGLLIGVNMSNMSCLLMIEKAQLPFF